MSDFATTLSAFDKDINRLDAHMRTRLRTEVSLAADIIMRQLQGGKKLRAIITMLSSRLCGLEEARGLELATAIEFIHTATLLHDDVVDDADTRRRRKTANRIYGNAAPVLVGDFLYSRASQILANLGSVRLLQRMTDATNRLSEGELLQLLARRSGNASEEMYYSIIERKTANLFEIAAAGPAILAEDKSAEESLSAYGKHLGLAFQLVDDCLDYEGGDTGKEVGKDFVEGKMTLPVIIALQKMNDNDRKTITEGWRTGTDGIFQETLRRTRESGALKETRARAQQEAETAALSLERHNNFQTQPETKSLTTLARTSPFRTA